MDSVEAQTSEFVQCVHDEPGVFFKKTGISGSLLVGLHMAKSDIDLIMYGRKNSKEVYDALARLMQERRAIFHSMILVTLRGCMNSVRRIPKCD